MKRASILLAGIGLLAVPPAAEAAQPKAAALASGLRACESWVLEPRTWSGNAEAFPANIGLRGKLAKVDRLPDGLLPPNLAQGATNFWRLDAGKGNAVFVAASVNQPVCNVAGGGSGDFQPRAEELLAEQGFAGRWRKTGRRVAGGIVTDQFGNAVNTGAELAVSRAARAGDRTDRVQFLATLLYKIRN